MSLAIRTLVVSLDFSSGFSIVVSDVEYFNLVFIFGHHDAFDRHRFVVDGQRQCVED